jgi:hypothetical protein
MEVLVRQSTLDRVEHYAWRISGGGAILLKKGEPIADIVLRQHGWVWIKWGLTESKEVSPCYPTFSEAINACEDSLIYNHHEPKPQVSTTVELVP